MNEPDDDKVEEKIIAQCNEDKKIDISNVKTSVVNGTVTLEGSMATLRQKLKIEKLARKVAGVKEVVNKILVLPKQSVIFKDLVSEDLSDERLIHIVSAHLSKLECYFGSVGSLILLIFLAISAILTPNYSPLTNTVSSLGNGIARTLFSIGFVTAGCLGIPFIMYLEKALVRINEFIRRIATGTAIITSLSVALVGILPDPEYPDTFLLFHGTIAFIAFFGSVIYICLYSYLMLRSKEYKLYHIIIGFATALDLLLLAITRFNPLTEWILTINIMIWFLITSIKLINQ